MNTVSFIICSLLLFDTYVMICFSSLVWIYYLLIHYIFLPFSHMDLFNYWTPGLRRKGLRVCPSVRFLAIGSLVFSESMVLEAHIYSCVWQSLIFWKNSPSGKNDKNWSKMAQ